MVDAETEICEAVAGLSTFSVDANIACDSDKSVGDIGMMGLDNDINQGVVNLCEPDECTKDDWVNLMKSKNEGCTVSVKSFTSSSGFSRASTIGGRMGIILAGALALI
eukprot:CAMPEP_0198265094 /NCGR_PEP_ID=MMETSP1447-20131203/20254_1 /TAXON_ID=420782 /ORGANISM="Chaetoceros dichaeta, Strain CCMP1751" /LENGTH=107 /DNA_ID=CAMNT_0043954379 /DNA_START=152 /DNA_END=475 /DNA_ORIENTATION=+